MVTHVQALERQIAPSPSSRDASRAAAVELVRLMARQMGASGNARSNSSGRSLSVGVEGSVPLGEVIVLGRTTTASPKSPNPLCSAHHWGGCYNSTINLSKRLSQCSVGESDRADPPWTGERRAELAEGGRRLRRCRMGCHLRFPRVPKTPRWSARSRPMGTHRNWATSREKIAEKLGLRNSEIAQTLESDKVFQSGFDPLANRIRCRAGRERGLRGSNPSFTTDRPDRRAEVRADQSAGGLSGNAAARRSRRCLSTTRCPHAQASVESYAWSWCPAAVPPVAATVLPTWGGHRSSPPRRSGTGCWVVRWLREPCRQSDRRTRDDLAVHGHGDRAGQGSPRRGVSSPSVMSPSTMCRR